MSNTDEAIDLVVNEPISFDLDTPEHVLAFWRQWVEGVKAMLTHMASIPEGTIYEDASGNKHELSGEFIGGFQTGLEFALLEISNTPFGAKPSPEAATSAEDEST